VKHPSKTAFILCALLLFETAALASPIKRDEEIVFFPTAARLSADMRHWVVPIHAWVFEPERNSLTRRAALGALALALGLDSAAAESAVFRERAGWFLVDNERGKRFAVNLVRQTLGPTSANGHLKAVLHLQRIKPVAERRSFTLAYGAILPRGDPRLFRGEALAIAPKGLSVVSDIDDTIKISQVRDKQALMANTFLKPFEAAPGMADAYKRLAAADGDAAFHYVSSSPWQLYPVLRTFMDAAGFPLGSFHLKDFRVKDRTFFKMFTSSKETKPPAIAGLLGAYPDRGFILIGDSGEADPEIYADIAPAHPGRIRHIYIRKVTPEAREDARYTAAFADLPASLWTLFEDAAVIKP
jgi:hypothetical protein